MREIEFRGLDKKGIWTHGLLATLSDGETLIIENNKDGYKHKQLIIPETVSQYIGIKDINQKKVFQGDIVKVQRFIFKDCHREEVEGMEEYIGEVVWHQYAWHIAEKIEHGIRYHSLWLWNVKDDKTDPNTHFMEILGDRYSNPEMKVIE